MKLQELTTDEMMNIHGGHPANFFHSFFYATVRAVHYAAELSASLSDNPNYGNPSLYK